MSDKPVSVRDQIDPKNRMKVAEAIVEEWRERKGRRKDREKQWDEVDRQLRMEPELSHKLDSAGRKIKELAWLPETELPLQSQTLEMLMADVRRMKFPKNRSWFSTRAALTQDYLQKYRSAGSPFPGEGGPNPTDLQQDDADRIVEAVVNHWHSQYDFRGAMDLIDASAFKYGFGVGRVRPVRRNILGVAANIGPSQEVIPVLVPRDPRKVYLDDSTHAVMHEGEVIGPNTIQHRRVKLADLRATASSDETYDLDQVRLLVPDKNGEVDLVEMEGDIVVDVGSEVVVVRNVIATAAVGTERQKSTFGLVRVLKGEGISTYIASHYQEEAVNSAYGSAPLIKGMPIARVLAQIMNRMLESGMLKNGPPLGYNRDDPSFAAGGGPRVHPYAKWPTTDDINVYAEVGGDQSVLFEIFQGLTSLYYDVVGVTPARLGAQTKSHTTAFAKDVELNRGQSRTVDYANQCLEGWMPRLLEIEYRMGRPRWRKRPVFIHAWNEFAEFERAHLPNIVKFIADGAGAPAEEEARRQRRFDSAQAAIQLDLLRVQAGQPSKIDMDALIEEILRDGGWSNPEDITLEGQTEGAAPAQAGQLPGVAAAPPEPQI